VSAFTRATTIRFAHCDPAGLVFYPQFFALVNDWFAGPLQCPFRQLHLDERMGVPTVRFEADFLRPARLGDRASQRLSVTRLGKSSCELRHDADIDGAPVARFVQTLVYVDLRSMRAMPWPAPLRQRIAAFKEDGRADPAS
jgi:4-hydroxybenzoyl-CoA thioesterase